MKKRTSLFFAICLALSSCFESNTKRSINEIYFLVDLGNSFKDRLVQQTGFNYRDVLVSIAKMPLSKEIDTLYVTYTIKDSTLNEDWDFLVANNVFYTLTEDTLWPPINYLVVEFHAPYKNKYSKQIIQLNEQDVPFDSKVLHLENLNGNPSIIKHFTRFDRYEYSEMEVYFKNYLIRRIAPDSKLTLLESVNNGFESVEDNIFYDFYKLLIEFSKEDQQRYFYSDVDEMEVFLDWYSSNRGK